MALASGSRIGSYVVLSLIGQGGMGEVYRARDTVLDREVAIKRLPDAVAGDPERLARFEREARVLAALNHPNVAQIYAVESGTIVMELVPGEPVKGPVPLDLALDYAGQIASALDAAHEKGIVHRDLKPGNVLVTPDGVVKVLDFGLAACEAARADVDPSQSPTLTAPISAGMILGTAAYMAPEQAAGKTVDKRADIFAFGVLLWEMLTGRRMFEGETVSHVLAAVLTQTPDLSAVPAEVRHLLSRCLEKDPKKRLRDIGDAMSLVPGETAALVGHGSSTTSKLLSLAGWGVAAVIAVLVLLAWPRSMSISRLELPVTRFSIPRAVDLYAQTASAFAVSPDGRKLAYHDTAEDGQFALFVRDLATGDTQEVKGAIRVFNPRPDSLAWSRDGRQLVRAQQNATVVIDVESGASRTICECRIIGASWNDEGAVLVGVLGLGEGIRLLSTGKAAPQTLTHPGATSAEQDRWPVFLPDGRRFLFTRTSAGTDAAYVGSLDGSEPRRIGDGSPRVLLAAPDGGHRLILIDSSGASVRPFNLDTLAATGPATILMPGAASVSASANGVIATSAAGTRPRTIPTWFDRRGVSLGAAGTAGLFESMALSDDGRVLVLSEGVPGRHDLWTMDLSSGVKTRLTFDPSNDSTPTWSPDGQRIVYTSVRGWARLYQRSRDGTGDETPFFEHERDGYVNDWSSDGRWVLYTHRTPDDFPDNDLWVVPIADGKAGPPQPYLIAPGRQQQGRFSPDGRFVVYGSDQSGTFEIYVQPFPDASRGKWMVSSGGGTEPRWSQDGKELFYFSGQTLMAVSVSLAPTFSHGTPVKLFDAPIPSGYTNEGDLWQVAPDGKRFLMLPMAGPQQAPPLDVMVNWPLVIR